MSVLKFLLNTLMPVWMIVFALIAYADSKPFIGLAPNTPYFLGAVILCMGLTLTLDKLKTGVIRNPLTMVIGFVSKWLWTVLPGAFIAFLVLRSYPALAAGTVLAGATPSGVSSNLFTFLGGGTVAVSVSLTIINTILAPILTPFFTKVFANRYVPVHFWSLFWATAKVVIIPIILGIVLRVLFKKTVEKIEPGLPLISAVFLYLVDIGTVAGAHAALAKNLVVIPILVGVVLFQILISLLLGYFSGYLTRRSLADTRAIMFETGIYNAGLGVVLATSAFGAFAAISPLLNMVLNMVIGAALASILTTLDERRGHHPVSSAGAVHS
ncbi:MAG: bile acid:sodium symporter family protein [Thermaerobacter sp.]|nr:bile acid:sodium symporter family protein [Thermaerobacter sp.]